MPVPSDPTGPAYLRYSRTPQKRLAVTSISATGLVTHSANLLDPYQNGDLCQIGEAVVGVPLSTAGPLSATSAQGWGSLYKINKVSTTTTQLLDVTTGLAPTVAPAAITIGVALVFGGLDTSIKSANIVAAGSVSGGGFGTPLD